MSSDLTKLRARVSAQERLTTVLLARIEELAEDMDTSFKQLVEYQTGTESNIATQFDAIRAELATLATKADATALEERLTATERRILDAFQQILTILDTRLPKE